MMSTWNAIPERELDRRAREDRRVDPLVEVDLVARVEEDAEERVAEPPVDDLRGARRPVWPIAERLVPLGDGLEVRPDEPVDVVARSRAGSSAASSTTNPARQFSAPQIPNATVNRSPRSIGRSLGLSRPNVARGPAVSIRWQDSGVPFQSSSRDGLALGHARAGGPTSSRRTPFDVWRAAHSSAAELVDLVDDAQAVRRRRSAGRWRSRRGRRGPTSAAELVDEERRAPR